MILNGNLTFLGGGVVESLRLEALSANPVAPLASQIWVNSTDSKIRANVNSTVVTLATGTDVGDVLTEVNSVETSVGLSADGTLPAFTGANFISASATIIAALSVLDSELSTVGAKATIVTTGLTTTNTNVTNLTTTVSDLQAELDLTQTGAGLSADGTLAAFTGANYIAASASLRAAVVDLDTQVKASADAVAGKLSTSGGTITGSLAVNGDVTMGAANVITLVAAPINSTDVVNKSYVDSLVQGIRWVAPVSEIVALNADVVTPTVGYRIINSTDNKIYTYNGTIWLGAVPAANTSAFVEISDEGYTYNSELTTWIKFTSTTSVNDGAGLVKVGNVINVGSGEGITVSADAISVSLLAVGGLKFDGSGAISVSVDAVTIAADASGVLSVQDASITSAKLGAVTGSGLQGGSGSAISAKADTGISVSSSGISVDTTWADARFINTSGDSMTGMLSLFAAPTLDLHAASKLYVDDLVAVAQTAVTNLTSRVTSGYFVYTSSAPDTSHTVTHAMGNKYVSVTVVDSLDNVVIPQSIVFTNDNSLLVTFNTSIDCTVIVVGLKSLA